MGLVGQNVLSPNELRFAYITGLQTAGCEPNLAHWSYHSGHGAVVVKPYCSVQYCPIATVCRA